MSLIMCKCDGSQQLEQPGPMLPAGLKMGRGHADRRGHSDRAPVGCRETRRGKVITVFTSDTERVASPGGDNRDPACVLF